MDATVQEKISLILKRKKISQEDAAKQMGVSRISVNRFLKGHTELRAGDFMKLLKVIDVDVPEIIGRASEGSV